MADLTTGARRQLVAGLVRHRPDVSLAEVRRAVRAAGHRVGDKTIGKDMTAVRGEIEQETIERRQEMVATLLARKLTRREMLRALASSGFATSDGTLGRDIAAVRSMWRERAAASIEELRASELADLREMERVCAQELARAGSDKDKARWVAEWRAIKARIAAMMGIDEPTKLAHSGEIDLGGGLSAEERREIAAAIAAAAEPDAGARPSAGAADSPEKPRARRAARKARP